MNRPTNQNIIKRYLEHWRDSKQGVKTRKSSLNYFFGRRDNDGDFLIFKKDKKTKKLVKCEKNEGKYQYEKDDEIFEAKYFGFNGHIFDITTDILVDYFDYLKHLKTVTLGTKKTKWYIVIGFFNFCMEYYQKYNFIVIIPKHSINWNGVVHKKPKTNKNVVMSTEEIESILDYLKLRNFKYYLIFRIFTETGMRKVGLRNIDYDKVNIEKRFIETIEKRNEEKVYYISKDLGKFLRIYLEERKLKNVETKALFLSSYSKRYAERQFNKYLKHVLKDLKIKKNITCHTFRRSLNTFRKVMGCPLEDRRILINHKVKDVNLNSYVKLNYNQYLELFDKWYPYKDIQI